MSITRTVLALALAGLLAVGLTTPAGAEPATPDPTGPAAPSPVDLTLTKIIPEVMRVQDELRFEGSINNASDQPLENITLWFRMQTLIPSDEGLTEWLAGRSENNVLTMARLDLDTVVGAGGSRAYTFNVPPESFPFDSGSDWGPRGIELIAIGNLTDSDRSTQIISSVRSTIFWLPDAFEAAPITVVAPLTPTEGEWSEAVARAVPVGTVADGRIGEISATLGDRVDTWGLDAALLDPAAILPDPLGLLIDAHASGDPTNPKDPNDPGTQVPTPALESAMEVASARGPIISLGWGRPDYPALMAAGTSPKSAGGSLLEASQDRATQLLKDAKLRIDPAVLWPGTSLTAAVADNLPEDVVNIITPSDNSTHGLGTSGNSTYETSRRILGMHAPHAALSEQVLRSSNDQAARSELLARTATALRQAPNAPLLLELPADLTTAGASHAASNLDLLHEAFHRAPFAHHVESSTRPIMGPQPPGLLSASDIDSLAAAYATANNFASMFDSDVEFASPVDAAVFTSLSSVWRVDPETRAGLTSELTATTDRLQSALTIEMPSTVNLISSGGELPVSISSAVPVTVTARVELRPGDPRVQTGEPTEATLEPHRTTAVPVPITAVGNGNIPMTIHLLDADGADVADPQSFTMRVRADWETTGTAVLAGLVLIGFIFGLYRNISGARRPTPGGHPRD